MHGARTHPRPRWPRRAQHPGTHIALQEALSDAVVRAVAAGTADVGVFGENTPAFGLVTSVCDVDDLVLLVPHGHALAAAERVAFAQALAYDFIAQERESSLGRLMAVAAERAGSPLRLRIMVKSFDAMCRMIACGLGVGVLPSAAAEPLAQSMMLREIRLNEPWARRRLLVGRREGPAPTAVQAVLEAIEAHAKRDGAE